MVWGWRDHFCDHQFWSVRTKLAPAANYGARFCGKVGGARVDARRSNFGIRRFRARSRGLQSLGAIRPMVFARQTRQNGSNRVIFCDFHFCGAIARAHGRLRRLPFGTWRFRAWPQGVHSLGAIGPMVFARQARQNGSNRGFVAPCLQSLQTLHQVCKVRTKPAKSATGTLNSHFVISLWNKCMLYADYENTWCRLCALHTSLVQTNCTS
jgi:hypothetical protein